MKKLTERTGTCKICGKNVFVGTPTRPIEPESNQSELIKFSLRNDVPPLCGDGQEHKLDIFSVRQSAPLLDI